MPLDLFAGQLSRGEYDALKALAGFLARSANTVFYFGETCSELEKDLEKYEKDLRKIDVPSSSAELSAFQEAVRELKQKIEEGRKLLEDCIAKEISWKSKLHYAKKIKRFREELKQIMGDNRLLIIGISQLKEEFAKFREEEKAYRKEQRREASLSFAATPPMPELVVGLEYRVGELRSMLLPAYNAAAEKNSGVIAIVGGMAGIGKTTLAKAICKDQQVRDFFHNRIYFFTVSLKPNMVTLCSTIWTKVTGDMKVPSFQNSEDACMQLQWKLKSHMRNSKCLLVLDDVWSMESMENLTFNIPEIWTLVTTRNAHKLQTIETLEPYNLALLDQQNARQLFCFWAFGQQEQDIPSWANKTLVEEVIAECKGLPLALKVIARSLSTKGRNEEAWRRMRNRLRQAEALEKDEQKLLFDRLRTSVDDLDKQLKDCFMDLAAFPEDSWTLVDLIMDIWIYVRGMDSDEAYCALIELAHLGLLNLSYRSSSLIEFVDAGDPKKLAFSQHDVLRDLTIQLGRHNNSPKVEEWRWLVMPQKQPSLPLKWQLSHPLVAAQIISIHLTKAPGGIKSTTRDYNWPSLDLPNVEALLWYDDRHFSKDHIYQLPSFIGNMPKLKVLILSVRSRSTLGISIPIQPSWENLKVIYMSFLPRTEALYHTHEYNTHMEGLPCDHLASLQKLVIIGCEALLEGEFQHGICFEFEKLQSLKELKLSHMGPVQSLPNNLSKLSLLEKLNLFDGVQLHDLPHDIGNLKSLKELKLRDAKILDVLPVSFTELSSLERLELLGCFKLRFLPSGIENLQSLKELTLTFWLHGLENLRSLKELTLGDGDFPSCLPENLSNLSSLEILNLIYPFSLPDNLSKLSSLKILNISNCNLLEHLPHDIGNLQSLKKLKLSNAINLELLPESLFKLSSLETLDLSSFESLMHLPDAIGKLQSLKKLILSEAFNLDTLPDSLSKLSSLETLNLSFCRNLKPLPHGIRQLPSLKELNLKGVDNLESVEDPQQMGGFDPPTSHSPHLPKAISPRRLESATNGQIRSTRLPLPSSPPLRLRLPLPSSRRLRLPSRSFSPRLPCPSSPHLPLSSSPHVPPLLSSLHKFLPP